MQPNFVEKNKPLRELNTWKVGGQAEFFCAPKTLDEIRSAWSWALAERRSVSVISGGSNVLIPDGTLSGLTLSMHEFAGIEKVDVPKVKESNGAGGDQTAVEPIVIHARAGTPKSEVAKIFLQHRLAPAVFLTGIPGDMGAGVVMNAGIGEARTPREFCEIVSEIEVLKPDQSLVRIPASELRWEYRHSSGWQPGIIVKVTVRWPMQPDPAVINAVREQTKKRVATQPLDLPNCGSVFRNPHGHKAAQLIESCALKGYRIGGACVSKKHANFIVNDEGASAADISKIVEHVRAEVLKQTGVQLETEIVKLGNS